MRIRLFIELMRLLPQNWISYWTGRIAEIQLRPPLLARWVCQTFVNLFHIDMTEAEHPLSAYPTPQAVFTRRLRHGMRPIEGPFCSPADGTLTHSAPVQAEDFLPAKRSIYSLGELVYGDAQHPAPFASGWTSTVYLAPHNYHRVHSPVSGTLRTIRHIPGRLWSVAPILVKYLPRLFVENERVVFDIETQAGHAYVIMVGALNVGKISPAGLNPPFYSNMHPRGALRVSTFSCERVLQAGDELGTFLLGSTAIVLLDQGEADCYSSSLKPVFSPRSVKMGTSFLSVGNSS
jgi:phosphatidylserine decarboxylase